MSILFINGGEKNGNTVALAQALLQGHEYEELDLADYKVYDHGQHFADDQFDEVLAHIKAADTLVIGSPVYWHDLSGMTRNLLDRFYGPVPEGSMTGKRLYFLFQGGAPTPEMLHRGDYTIGRFAALYGMEYVGIANNRAEAEALGKTL